LCYRDESVARRSLQVARTVQKAFVDNYLGKVGSVRLTADNIAQHLFSIVTFSDAVEERSEIAAEQEDKSLGIVTNYKVVKKSALAVEDQKSLDVLAFVTLFSSSKEGLNTAWVSLKDTCVYADLSLGQVSQKWLEKFQVHDYDGSHVSKVQVGKQAAKGQTRVPLSLVSKLRQLQMLNWQESLSEKLNTLVFPNSLPTSLHLRDEEMSHEFTGRKEIRAAVASNDTHASICKKCNYRPEPWQLSLGQQNQVGEKNTRNVPAK